MIERGPQQAKRMELMPGDNIVQEMLSAVRRLREEPSITIVGKRGDVTFSQKDATDWLRELQQRGGEAVTFRADVGTDIYRDFSRAREKDPRTALACARVEIPSSASSLETLQTIIDAVLYKTGSTYIEGNAVTARMPGGETFYITDTEIGKSGTSYITAKPPPSRAVSAQ